MPARYARLGNLSKCDYLMTLMQNEDVAASIAFVKEMFAQIKPTPVTYGILLDCCINADDMARAQRVFEEIRQQQSFAGNDEGNRKSFSVNTVRA